MLFLKRAIKDQERTLRNQKYGNRSDERPNKKLDSNIDEISQRQKFAEITFLKLENKFMRSNIQEMKIEKEE